MGVRVRLEVAFLVVSFITRKLATVLGLARRTFTAVVPPQHTAVRGHRNEGGVDPARVGTDPRSGVNYGPTVKGPALMFPVGVVTLTSWVRVQGLLPSLTLPSPE